MNDSRDDLKEIARGAEAIIYETEGRILKIRPQKTYRTKELDELLRSRRTQLETTMINKARPISPEIIQMKQWSARKENPSKKNESRQILMEKIDGKLVKEALDNNPELGKLIGKTIAELHNRNIIHGDLTTSNMILEQPSHPGNQSTLRIIDFGLSYTSHKIEDKAVDLHLLRQAIESKHAKVFEEAWKQVMQGYNPDNKKAILERFQAVEHRGRHKKKAR